MKNDIEQWKTTAKILDFLGVRYEFERKGEKKYPFCKGIESIQFFTPYITIPQKGIEQVVLNKLSDVDDIEQRRNEIKEIEMLVHIPYLVKEENNVSNLVINVSLSFCYDKTYKYGDITRNKAEVCYAIMKYAKRTNDFYVIHSEEFNNFMSYYVINNQWGIGTMMNIENIRENINKNFEQIWEEEM